MVRCPFGAREINASSRRSLWCSGRASVGGLLAAGREPPLLSGTIRARPAAFEQTSSLVILIRNEAKPGSSGELPPS